MEDKVCTSPGTAVFSHQCREYENLFTGMFTNVPGVDMHVCMTKCKITVSHNFFCPISVIWRDDCAAIGKNLWSAKYKDKKSSKVNFKALVGFLYSGRTWKMLMRSNIFLSNPFKREWYRDSKTFRGMMKGTWYIILLWRMLPHNTDTYNLPSYFYSCREGGQPMSQLVLVRQDPGNRNLQWETEGLGFCFDT